jgi:hypothetical protein
MFPTESLSPVWNSFADNEKTLIFTGWLASCCLPWL